MWYMEEQYEETTKNRNSASKLIYRRKKKYRNKSTLDFEVGGNLETVVFTSLSFSFLFCK